MPRSSHSSKPGPPPLKRQKLKARDDTPIKITQKKLMTELRQAWTQSTPESPFLFDMRLRNKQPAHEFCIKVVQAQKSVGLAIK